MPSTVFLQAAQARASLIENKFVKAKFDREKKTFVRDGEDLSKTNYIDGYAAIVTFLCDRERFTASLRKVSQSLWIEYLSCDKNEHNKFTKAMGVVARRHGFTFQNQLHVNTDRARNNAPIGIVLVAGDPLLGTHVRNKLFFKDSMDSRHGEHSHSLQWLAIAESGVVGDQTAEFYANTVNFRCKPKGIDDLSVTMWQWVVDCFPSDMKKFATETLNNGETLESESFRAPQCLMDYLLMGDRRPFADHFLSTYLYWRYKNRNWLAEQTAYSDTDGEMYNKVTDIQTTGIATHNTEQWQNAAAWTPGKTADDKVVRYKRNPGYVKPPAVKGAREVRFHNISGRLYDSYAK